MLRTYKLTIIVYAVLCSPGTGRANPFLRIPEQDREILSKVAREYRLTLEERRLLFAIRLAESGGPGRELGVLTPQAQRYKGDHAKSLRLQAQWAAGTIKKRYNGDLHAFALRWCPPDAHELNGNWEGNVRRILRCRERRETSQ